MNAYGDSYRGEGFTIAPGCLLPAHFMELQAFADALGHAAQTHMARALEDEARLRSVLRMLSPRSRRRKALERCLSDAVIQRERFYAHWLAYGWLIRAVENNTSEMDSVQKAALGRIDWSNPQRPVFRFPGHEVFDGIAQHLPGEAPTEEVANVAAK